MGAIGFVLLVICAIRMGVDEPKYFPMTEDAKGNWGIVLICGVMLIAASITKALWEYMP